MFVNAILHHEVPVFDEKTAKFFDGRYCRDSSRVVRRSRLRTTI